jgi:methylenetetrahydrofolate reductase (NADPH)
MSEESAIRFSYEFFPPRTECMYSRLWRAIGQLERLRPQFFSMTYGALGSARQVSIDSALAMHGGSPVPVAAHLTCGGASRHEVDAVARRVHAAGIRRIVALRGDAQAAAGGYASVAEMIGTLRGFGEIDISVAAYPETHPLAESAAADLLHLKAKLDAGAQRAISQFFFDPDCFLRFRDRARAIGVDQPLVPGILPVHDLEKVRAFGARCGASVPEAYTALFAKLGEDPEGRYRLAVELAVDLCQRLNREGVEDFHFYTLNQTDMCLDISLALGAKLQAPQLISAA